ncbi:Glycerol ABC transporter, ATP-binding protein [Mycoplasmopsis bovigenitalium 51080]|uniref:Glycerol ABC transporter, ATP-binding protein n=1 Tax=Mycoplasmopsis bovigenitalium 51080 TaxID=1188235 RepID=N9VDU3_9BACT|nr:ABC transporter ATP-binding protein [Mycoplasmopsis bovigenitalium]ENY69823.1 Glycerol ABC transporter, ATP-binding protein [Mycoplasmopsis bovigenitalium 51080]
MTKIGSNSKNVLVGIKNLKFKYNKKSTKYDLEIPNLEIEEGKLISLLGPSGSGKTTLFNILLGFLKPENGKISIKNNLKTNEIAYIMQENSIYENVSVFNNIFLSAKNNRNWIDSSRIEFLDQFSDIKNDQKISKYFDEYVSFSKEKEKNDWKIKFAYFKLWISILFSKKIRKKWTILKNLSLKKLFKKELDTLAKKLEIDHLINKNVDELSGGQKQRVAFAKGIVKRTNFVLMDEPFSALDAKIKESTIDWLLKIKNEFNLSIIIVTHDQQDAMKISDKIILLSNGKVQQFSTGQEMYENPTNLFVAKFIGSPEINFIKEEDNKLFYIRQNKINVSLVKEGKYKIINKKHFGDKVQYQIEFEKNNIWSIVLNEDNLKIGDFVDIDYSKNDVLIFDKNGERINE